MRLPSLFIAVVLTAATAPVLAQSHPYDAKSLAHYDVSYVECEARHPEMAGHRDEAYLSLWRITPDAKSAARLAETRAAPAYKSERQRVAKSAKALAPGRGYLCQKAARLDAYQNNDDQGDDAVRRRRADGSFERATWDEALTAIAEKLTALRAAHGGSCFAFYGGGGQGNHSAGPTWQPPEGDEEPVSLQRPRAGEDRRLLGERQAIRATSAVTLTEDVEHADSCCSSAPTPGRRTAIRNARDAVRDIKNDRPGKWP